jgi:nucleotide-binding universal stress UspA family protein
MHHSSKCCDRHTVPALLRTRGIEVCTNAHAAQKWLVPVDGTAASVSAVEYVVEHADKERIHVHLLNVQPPLRAGEVSILAPAELVAQLRRSAGALALRAAKALLKRHAFTHSAEVILGNPADAIVRSAAERGCTKIVMGSRGIGVIGTVFGRSVSSRVARLASVPVTLVKPEALRGSEEPSFA